MALSPGTPAPDFTLFDQDGVSHSLNQERGKWVLIYFYPKDDTPGCTTEACGIRDRFSEFKKAGITVFGVSADSVKSHKKFAEKFHLTFPLLSDPDKAMIEAYGAFGERSFMGKKYRGIFRISYLISPEGKIAKVYEKVKPEEHAQEVIQDINALQ